MPEKKPSIMLGIKGAVCGLPLQAGFINDNGHIYWYGKASLQNDSVAGLFNFVGGGIGDSIVKNCPSAVSPIHCDIDVFSNRNGNGFRLDTDSLFISGLKSGGDSAILLKLNDSGTSGKLAEIIGTIRKNLSVSDFYVMFRSGKSITLPALCGSASNEKIPEPADSYNVILSGRFVFGQGSVVSSAFKEIFGIEQLSLFLGADTDKGAFACTLAIPDKDGQYVSVKDMYISAGFAAGLSFTMSGTFQIKADMLKGVYFRTASSFSPGSFMISGEMISAEPVKLADWISLGGIIISLGFDKGITVGMSASLYIRKLSMFSAVMLECAGSAVNPLLLCAAVNKLSIPDLFVNLTGTDVEAVHTLDFIQINSFSLTTSDSRFDTSKVDAKDAEYIAKQFAETVPDKTLALSAGSLKVQKSGEDYSLTDTSRMRLYTITKDGKILLNAQFYFSDIIGEKQFGSYKISAGIFLCGVVSIFDIKFALLISYRPNDGLTAFAKIDAFDLKIGGFSICKVSGSKGKSDLITLPADSVVKQFSQDAQDGVVFFLSAGKKDVQFYFDGRIELLNGLITAEARLMYIQRNISLYASVNFLGVFKATVKIEASYANFSNAFFSLYILIDTSGLEDMLKGVTERINRAIEKLRANIDGAKRSLDSAQQNVDSLYQQINYMNSLIDGCRNAISNAHWWEKAFVAIAKGLEIAGYEIAKAGIYVAIGTATAALQIAKAAVSFAGALSEEVLKLVNNVINAAASLLVIKKMEIEAMVSGSQQTFRAAVTFRAIGHEYTAQISFGHGTSADQFKNNATGSMNGQMEGDLNRLENGQSSGRMKKDVFELPTHEEMVASIQNAMNLLQNSGQMMSSMIDGYKDEFGEDFSRFQELQRSFADTLSQVKQSLAATTDAVEIDSLKNTVDAMNNLTSGEHNLTDENVSEINDASEAFKNVSELHGLVSSAISTVNGVIAETDRKEKPAGRRAKKPGEPSKDMNAFMQKLAKEVNTRFYTPQDTGYINLAKEPVILESINGTIEQFGGEPLKQPRRGRAKEAPYTPRI